MTEWNNPAELGSNTSTTKPCDACPMFTWGYLHDPATREFEKQIRADERLRFQRTFDAWAVRLQQSEDENARLRAQLKKLQEA